MCDHPFAGLEGLNKAAHNVVLQAYDALAQWHVDAQWCARPPEETSTFPLGMIHKRAIQLHLEGDVTAQRIFADTEHSLRLASKFLAGPSYRGSIYGRPLHRFFVRDLALLNAVADRLNRSPEHASARQTFVAVIPEIDLNAPSEHRRNAQALRQAYPGLSLA